jgi:thiol:disulfide interchange protein DsbC
MKNLLLAPLVAAALIGTALAQPVAQEAAIRKGLGERLTNLPRIDEIRATPIAGMFEVRVGNEILYTDAEGNYIVRGEIIDLKTRRNLTEERIDRLTAIDFAALPLKDAIVWKTGTGKRKIAVFADPNCGYCKRFENELSKVKDVTVYTFLMPVLGGDSPDKSRAIWCAKDPTAAWRNWMLEGTAPPRMLGECATPIERNMEFGRRYRINGTPAIVFEDGSRVPGMISAPELEKRLAAGGKS